MSYYIKHTNAPWAVDKELPTEKTTMNLFESSPEVMEGMFQSRYGQDNTVSNDYLQKFEVMLQIINLFFTSRFNNEDESEIPFEDLWNKQPGTGDEVSYPGRMFTCDVFVCRISFYKEAPKSLVLKLVITRPCAEGLGFYKIFIWQLILICRRMRFETLFIDDCVPENFEMLRIYFGFDETPHPYNGGKLNNCSLSLEKMDSIGDNLPWGLHKLIKSWSIHRGIVLKNYESFAYPDQLNNEFYVNEKFRNIGRNIQDKVNLKHPFYGYPCASERKAINKEFDEREDSFQVAIERTKPIPFMLQINPSILLDIKNAVQPSFPVSIIPSTVYEGFPIASDFKTYVYNEIISLSQENAAQHIPMLQGGYYARINRNTGVVKPDYKFKEDYFNDEELTNLMREKALKHKPEETLVLHEHITKRSKTNDRI